MRTTLSDSKFKIVGISDLADFTSWVSAFTDNQSEHGSIHSESANILVCKFVFSKVWL